ncbi:MAG: MerR family transcriptional regulator [Dehalococcoidia bacterium]|nr:MerR family transcriptional regulator [Dehalococcoidia bacterium]MDD5493172.1 MerR family transcriptional regulator [Dehalococcoidia bacterium]
MKKASIAKTRLMRIGEVAKATGVSLPTIHYYVREGLISPEMKTARNMAYYAPECVDDIRLIKELQAKRFLPLSLIKLVMNAKHEGQDIGHLAEMRSFLDDIFQPVGEPASKSLTFDELIDASGLSVSGLNTLETQGLLMPSQTANGRLYDDIDLRIARIAKELAGYGLTPDDLSVYKSYIKAIHTEARTIHEKIHGIQERDTIPITRLINALNSMKSCLATKIYRQIALELH